MTEILVWGDISADLARLNISPKCTHIGPGWPDDGRSGPSANISVYELTEEEFKIMCDDCEGKEDGWLSDGCWRWAEGSNMFGSPTARYNINHHYMIGWDGVRRQDEKEMVYNREYDHLLQYLCDEIGASMERNIVALAVDLAKMNGLTMAQLFKKYQGEFKDD